MRNTYACLLVFIALSARADIYRCIDSDGQIRFTDDASGCEIAQPVTLEPAPASTCDEQPDCSSPASPTPVYQLAGPDRDLSAHFVPLRELDSEWSLVDDAPEPIDSESRSYGLTDTSTRHYARSSGRVSQVCSVELWQFEQADAASRVASSLALPHWQVLQAGSLLVLTHGVRLELGASSDARLHEACVELGRLTHERISRGH